MQCILIHEFILNLQTMGGIYLQAMHPLNFILLCRMVAEYIKAARSLLVGVAAVMAAYNIRDGRGLARDGLLGHMSAEEHNRQVHIDRHRTRWMWMPSSK